MTVLFGVTTLCFFVLTLTIAAFTCIVLAGINEWYEGSRLFGLGVILSCVWLVSALFLRMPTIIDVVRQVAGL
jgi:hypothetical protein